MLRHLQKWIVLGAFCGLTTLSIGQNTLDNLGLTASTPSAAAFSLRKLSSAYAGSAIRVRRSSDNAQQDIGFTGGGDLDQAALLAFVGGSNGFITIWYDQSGLGRDAVQATAARQATIVSAGAVTLQNGKASLLFSGAQTLQSTLTAVQATTGGNITTSNFVFQNATVNSSLLSNGDPGTNRYNLHAAWGDGNTYYDLGDIASGGRVSTAQTWLGYSIGTFKRNGAQGDIWKNGINFLSRSSFATNVTSANPMWIGSYNGASNFINGYVGEVLIFPSALSDSERNTLENNQSAYYAVAVAQPLTLNNLGLPSTTPSSGAFSLRKLSSAYAGPAVQVRRSSDNATQDIGFTGGGDLDQTALLTFVGAGDGYVTIWYDQSGYGRNGVQNTFASQPQIVAAGVVEVRNGKPTIIFSGSQFLTTSVTANQGTSGGDITTANFVGQNAVTNSSILSNDNTGNRYNIHASWSDGNTYFDIGNTAGGRIQTALQWTDYSVGTFRRDVANGDIWKNGVNRLSSSSVSSTVTSNVVMLIGGQTTVGPFMNGSLGEIMIFPSALSAADRIALECNQGSYYTVSFESAQGIEAFVTGTPVTSGCLAPEEQVSWKQTDLISTVASGNSLTRIVGNGWNGGAASWNTVANYGYMEFTATETTTARMAGLSTTNPDANYTTIQYAFYLQNGGNLGIYESGTNRGNFGTYSTNDKLRISIEAGVVKYYNNGTLLYISTISPALPLLVDVSINSLGGTIGSVVVSNLNDGTFTATVSGTTPTFYQWRVNGIAVGSNASSYTNSTLNSNDIVRCDITYSGICGTKTFATNSVTNKFVTNPTSIDFYIQGTVATSACNTVDEEVKWKISDLSNTQATGNNLLKIQSNGAWNGGAASWNTVSNNGYFQFTASETNTFRMIGLSNVNTDANWTTIQYAFYLLNNGTLEIREFGSGNRIAGGTYATNDIFKIAVEANVVKYYKNGTLLYISATAPVLPLLVDVSINTIGGTITNALVSNYNTGVFTATTTNAGTPSFQWLLNGTPVGGATTSTYTNTSLANNDVVTCTMTPGLTGCSLITPYVSNAIANKAVSNPTSIDFYIQGTVATSACNTADEDVKWKISDLANLQITGAGNSLSKLQSGGWNGGAASWNTVSNNGYLQFIASETTTQRMAGLSTLNTDANYTSIQYAFYLQVGGTLGIYESGTNRGNFGSYATNDILKIAVEANVVKYYKNGVLLYISANAPTLPLLVDISINTVGGTITSAIVSNYNTGVFTATATNAGTPSFQWILNGTPVGGATTSTYTNTSLANNDIVTCTMTPSLGGCTLVAPYTSNAITNKAVSNPTSIDFYIQGTVAASACNTVDEEVKWKISDLSNTQATGNNLLKIQSNGAWNGGAASWNTVSNNGYFQFTATETNTSRMAGLSTVNTDANWATIQYAFYLLNNATLEIRESGSGNLIAGGTYATNDVFKIAVEANVVKYYKNGTLLYISATAPVLPLLVDVSINTIGGTITNAIVSNYNTGAFTATATNAGTPSFQWLLNGTPVGGATTSTYTNTSLANNDVVTCTMTPSLGGCTLVAPYTSNAITNKAVSNPVSIDFYIQGTVATSACNTADENVKWKISDLANLQITGAGNSLSKLQSGGWNGGAASWNTVSNNGYLQFTASETTTQRMAGLSTTNADASYLTIQYAFYLQVGGTLGIYESGASRGNFGSYATNDILKIAVEANVVKYYKNGVLLYISANAPTLPLLVDISINTVGGTITSAIVSNYNTGVFTATATNAGTPSFQWLLNGTPVGGATTSTYTNTSLANNDIVTCTMTPSLGGCTLVAPYTSNAITNKAVSNPTSIDFYIQGTVAASACNTVDEEVKWKISDLSNTQATGNNLLKIQSSGAWNGGAASWNTVSNNGYFQFTATETNTSRMAGLSTVNTDANWATIQYAFYLLNNATLEIRESGSGNLIAGGTYATNDVFKIAVEANVVKYYKNGTLLYISATAPVLPLLVDVSINTIGGTITNAIVSNYNTGAFTATATNAGTPSFQWLLNGTPVGGATTSTYTNTSLANNDVVTCTMTPSLGGCTLVAPYTSNAITNKAVSNPVSIDFYIQGTVATSACNTADENVKWKISDLANLQITGAGNSLSKLQSGGWNGGAASWNTVSNYGYFQFTASETTTQRMAGLSTTNVDASNVTIQYAFFLQVGGTLGIYESGASRGNFGSYATNDILKIAVEANVVKYYKNGVLLYISANAPTLPLLVDISINTVGGTITSAIVSNYNTGVFTATATNAGTPSFQWLLNGTPVGGATTSTYTNTSLANNDIVTCTMTPSLGGCTLVAPYTSNAITNKAVSNPTSIDFYIQGTVAASACNTVDEEVKWKISDLSNTQATGNNLLKIQSNGNWNGGAASWNTVSNNGYLQFTASETNTFRMVGLSNVNIDANWTTIQYAFYLLNNATLEIRESGSGNRIAGGTYATNDVFKIAVEANVVKYYKNGTLLYISANVPTLPLLTDVSIYSTGGTVTNAIVSNYNTGAFTATATNAGTPAFQWFVNGSPIGGATTSTYTNTSLANNDIVTCTMSPGLPGCSVVAPYTSNAITNKAVTNPIGIDFYIQGTVTASACNTADEDVKWKISDLANLQITGSGNSLSKLQSGGWNGGAASWNTVSNYGYFQFTASETTTQRMAGLSTTNADASNVTIQYAFFLQAGGILGIYESGTSRGNFGSYATNDILKIAVEANVVKYYKNGVLLYISANAPTLPLLVDISINTVGGTITSAIVSNYNTGVFTATATNAGTPSFQWLLNGTPVGGATTSTYTNTSLANNDIVTCTMTPSLGGCTLVAPYTSNAITNKAVGNPTSIDFYIQGSVATSACNTVDEEVKWKISDLSNVQATGNALLKIQSNGNWNGGAASWNTVSNNGYLQFTASETNTARMAGLSTSNADANYTTIQYAFYLQNGGNLGIYESGNNRGNFGTYAISDIFKIAVEANVVKYYKNGTLLYISANVPTLPLLADVSINSTGGTITNAIVSNYNTGMFTATATNAGTPAFQWFVNGSPIGGATTSTYTNASLANNDVVTCQMTPSLGGCSLVTPYASNTITNKAVTNPIGIDFYVAGTTSTTACTEAIEQVVWKTSDLLNNQANGNNLLKINAGGWNGGAASWNTVNNNGYFQFTASETNTDRMAGLSNSNANANYTSIQYAIYLQTAGTYRVYESGTDRGGFGAYASNDVFRIGVEGNVVKYFRNGVLFYTSAIAPTLPLLVDVSINTTGGTITNALVANNSNAGTFTATTINAGVNPTFDWRVNGISVQLGTSNVYTNNSLAVGDVVTSILTPNLGGCASTNYTSNSITINGPGATPSNWTGASDGNWYNALNWDSGIPNKFKAANIPSGTPNALTLTASANVYDITIQPGATFTISGANQLYVFRNFTNNGTFVANTSRVNFIGCAGGTLSSSGTQTFYNVTINTTYGLTIASGTHQISNNFTFTNGIVTQNATLLFLAGSSATGANSLSYVNGPVRKAGTTAFVFPTGSASRFARIGIGAPTVSTTFTAQYFSTSFGNFNRTAAPLPAFTDVSGEEYWTLNQTVGAGNATVTLYWENAAYSKINDCSTTDLRVARFNGTGWQNNNNVVTTTGGCTLGTPAGTISTTAVVTLFGTFTFGSLTLAVNPLPIKLVYFKASLQDEQALIEWETASEKNNDYFEIEKSIDGKQFVAFYRQSGEGNSNTTRKYSTVDSKPYAGQSYYRLKQVDFDGRIFYSKLASIQNGDQNIVPLEIFPNPSQGSDFTIRINNYNGQPKRLLIYSTLGLEIRAFDILEKGIREIPGNAVLTNRPKGVYIAILWDGSTQYVEKFIVE